MSNLISAQTRACFYVPDALHLLRPRPGLTLSIGARYGLNVQDAANQTLAAGTTAVASFNPNTIVAGAWVNPPNDQVVLIERYSARVFETDANGQIQVMAATLGLGDGAIFFPAIFSSTLPYTLPAVINGDLRAIAFEQYLYLASVGITAPLNGPNASFWLKNLDAVGAHTYRRQLTLAFRYIRNVDLSLGPTAPGAGIG